MSCALDVRFGMPALKDHLLSYVVPESGESEQDRQWTAVTEDLKRGDDLENALDNVADSALLQKITATTGRFISSLDREFAMKIASREVAWPATAFFGRLVDALPEGDPVLHVLTPNYDTLFEHACDSVGVLYTSGFFGGFERHMDWSAVDQSMMQKQLVRSGSRMKPILKKRKYVRLYKVHGSLNLFFHQNTVVEHNAWAWDPPKFADRVMITPGLSKYEMLQNCRQELLRPADEEITKANRFLFLGYGFNDSHLEAYIKQKLILHACNGLIVTRDSNPRIEALLQEAPNLWLVCKMPDEGDDGTRVFNNQYAGWLTLPAKRIWDIQELATDVLGV